MNSVPDKWLNLGYLTQRTHDEWSSACPKCGDAGHVWSGSDDVPDRFRIFLNGNPRGWCRGCQHFEFADNATVTPTQVYRYREEAKDRAIAERLRVKEKIKSLEQEAEWRGFHAAMRDKDRNHWREAGINDAAQDWWELGYNPECIYKYNNNLYKSPALTIPYFKQGHVVNMQSRLLEAEPAAGKYRFSPGLPAALYYPEKDELPFGTCLIVEGGKKAMVVYLHLAGSAKVADSIVGLPSKYLSDSQLDSFKNCDNFILALDPDANHDGTAVRNAEKLGFSRTKIATLPEKIDDLIVKYGATGDNVARYIKDARYARYKTG